MFHSPPKGGLVGLKTISVMNTKKVVLGTVAGIALGAIASILFAPEKGSTTRKQIRDKSDEYVNKLKSMFDEFFDSLTQKFEGAKQDAEILAEKGKDNYYDAKKDIKNAATNFKHNVATDINHATS